MLNELNKNILDYRYVESYIPSHWRYNRFITKGSSLFLAILESVELRKKEAIQLGDTEELARLNKYYTNVKPEDFTIEEPIVTEDGYKFCYLNRNGGYLYPDSTLSNTKYSLRTIIKALGIETFVPETVADIDKAFDTGKDEIKMMDLSSYGLDLIIATWGGGWIPDFNPLVQKLGMFNTRSCLWPEGYANEEVKSIYGFMAGAILFDSPVLEGTSIGIPIMDVDTLVHLIESSGEGSARFVVASSASMMTYPIIIGEREVIQGPARPIRVLINDEYPTQAQRERISFVLYENGSFTGNVTPTWNNDGSVTPSMSISLIENEGPIPHEGYMPNVDISVQYVDSDGMLYNRQITIANVVAGYPPESVEWVLEKPYVVRNEETQPVRYPVKMIDKASGEQIPIVGGQVSAFGNPGNIVPQTYIDNEGGISIYHPLPTLEDLTVMYKPQGGDKYSNTIVLKYKVDPVTYD